jgi:hypothetical protein
LSDMKTAERFKGLDDWQVVCQFLPEGWQTAARVTGALRRTRGIKDAETLLRVLLVHLADGCSLHETAVRVRAAGWCELSSVALFKRLKAAEQWLRWLAERLWRRPLAPTALGGYRVRAVDATTVQEPGSTGTDWRVHFCLNLANLQCDHFEMTDAKGGETFRRIPVVKGDLMLGDRAYGTPPGVAHVSSLGGDVLVRVALHNMPLYSASGVKIPILKRLKTVRLGQAKEWGTWVRSGEHQIPGRLVVLKRSVQATREVQKRLRRKASRNQTKLSERALVAAGYVFVWTSVPKDILSAVEVLEYYRLRWQIELAFKRMKSILDLGHLPKESAASCRAWIHGKLFVALLIERLLEEAEAVSPWGYRLVPATQPLA